MSNIVLKQVYCPILSLCVRSPSLRGQTAATSVFIDSLAEQQRVDSLFPSTVSLIPPDIAKQMELDTRANADKYVTVSLSNLTLLHRSA